MYSSIINNVHRCAGMIRAQSVGLTGQAVSSEYYDYLLPWLPVTIGISY